MAKHSSLSPAIFAGEITGIFLEDYTLPQPASRNPFFSTEKGKYSFECPG